MTTFYTPTNRVTLFHGDRLDLVQQINDSGDKAKLILTSPPYNMEREYEKKRSQSLDEYVNDQIVTIEKCIEILSDTGSICWQVGHYIDGVGKDKEAFPLDLVLYPIFKSFGLKLRNRIVWHFGHGLHDKVRFSGRHETILWFTRDTPDYTFNLDPIRVPQKYPNKKHFKGDKKGEYSGNPLGKNPSDVWDIPNVKSNHVEKTDHPCQFPVALAERLVLALTNENDLVFDPYVGSGTTLVPVVIHNRRGAGSDTDKKYIDIAINRIEKARIGELKTRPMNKPIYAPK